MSESRKVDINRPILAISGYILDDDDSELRTLELAQRYFQRRVDQRGATEEEICTVLVWLAATRVQLHNSKGAMHTLAHLRARSRGRFRDIENLAGLLEVLLHAEMHESRQGMARLEMLRLDSPDERTKIRLNSLRHQLKGRFLSAMGQLRQAQEEFETAVNTLKAAGPAQLEDLVITAELYNDQAHTYGREGRGEDAIKLYSQVETVAKHISFPMALARSLRGRGSVYLNKKEFNEAIKFFKAALEIYQRHDSPYGILRCSINLGRSYYGIADLREALFYFEEARLQCGKGRYPVEEAEVNARIGDIMLSEGQYEKAAEFYEQDLQLAALHGDERSRAHALRNVGRIQRLLGNFGRADGCLHESGMLLTKLGDRLGLCQTLQQMVQSYLEQGRTAEARHSLNLLKDHAEKLNRPHEKGLARMLEGIVLRHEGQSQQAREMLEKSLNLLSREPGFFTVLCQVELAQAHFELGEKDLSVHQFKEAIQSARRLKHHDIEKRALDLLSKVDRSEWARILHAGAQAAGANSGVSRSMLSLVALELRGTGWLWTQDPERISALLGGFYEAMASVVQRQKAVLNRIVGHRMIAVYGLDATCDPVQAFRCAEACQEAFLRLQTDNPNYVNLGLACSISTGPSIHGLMGATDLKEYAIVGEPLELVDRLLDQAHSGEIWTCPDTYRAIHHLDAPATPKDVSARGGEDKFVAYQVASSKPVARKPGMART